MCKQVIHLTPEGAHPICAKLVWVPRGAKAPLSMGWVQGKGSTKAPCLGFDEVVSMNWSWGYRG